MEVTKDQSTEFDRLNSKNSFSGTPIKTKDKNDNDKCRENSTKKGHVYNKSQVEQDNKKKKKNTRKKLPKYNDRKEVWKPIFKRTKELKTLAQVKYKN